MTATVDPNPTSVIAGRITRILRGLERAKRQPNRREAFHLRSAIELLGAHKLDEAEKALQNAERAAPLPAHIATLVTTNQQVTWDQLQRELEQALS